jgi:CRP-like cAMP-binding protein
MNFVPVLEKCLLFQGMDRANITALLGCISPKQRTFDKNTFVIMENEECTAIGIVLSGVLHVVRDDYWGNRTIVARVERGELFAEAFVCGNIKNIPVSIIAVEKTDILLVDFQRIIKTCPSACVFHIKLIKNMISNLALQNISLMEKIEHITQHNTREKILSYLSSLAKESNSNTIDIPFKRQELAEYLSVDRSALSAELSRMRDEGMLLFHKNKFELLPALTL